MRLFVEEGAGRHGVRPRAPWRLLAQFLLFAFLTVVFSTLLTAAWAAIGANAAGPGGFGPVAGSPAVLLIGSFASLLAVFLSMWLAGRFLDRRPFRDFGLHLNGGWWLDLLFGMFLGALLMTLIFLTELAFGWISVTGSFESASPGTPFALAILLPLGIFLCVGVYEEMLYRGYQLRNAAEGLNYPAIGPRAAVVLAWVLTSAVFGLLHAANPNATVLSTFNIALAGLLLGAGYVLTGQLAIPIGLHITWNFFQGNVYGFPVSGLDPLGATFLTIEQGGPDLFTGGVFGPEAGLLDPAATALGILLIALWVKLRRGKVSIDDRLAERPEPDTEPNTEPTTTTGTPTG